VVEVLLPDRSVSVNLSTGVVGWADDWGVGTVLEWGRNYGPGTFGHTDVVLSGAILDAVRAEVASR
jgi:hypothetical protein